MKIVYSIINVIIFLVFAPLFEGVVRKITAKIQSRQGPPIIQPYYDLFKLLGKENFIKDNWGFSLAPIIALASIITAIAFVPHGFQTNILSGYADIITVIYLLTIGGVAVLLGALSSKNTYALIGASREMITMVMIEPIMAMTLILSAVRANSLSLDESLVLSAGSSHGWSVWLMMIVYIMALQAFVGRQPFDIAEAEVEILEGPFIEYSGPNYALFKYYLMLKQMFYAALFVIVFLHVLKGANHFINLAFEIICILAIFILIALLGATNPRLRIDQAIKYYAGLIFLSLCSISMAVYGI